MFRSYLFVPGDSDRKIRKSMLSGADVVILDIEDAVAPDNKAFARETVSGALQTTAPMPRYVRVNGLATGLAHLDVAATAAYRPDGYVLPKCEGVADLDRLSEMISAAGGGEDIRIIAVATETARAVRNLAREDWSHPRLSGLIWGGEDLAADIGASSNRDRSGTYRDVFRHARAVTLLAAREAGVAAIEAPWIDFTDEAGCLAESREGFAEGFDGKLAIHPAQVSPIHAGFSPTAAQVEWARAVRAALSEQGLGVARLNGQMLDMPHEKMAARILRLVERN